MGERMKNTGRVAFRFTIPDDNDITSIVERINSEMLGKPINKETEQEAQDLAVKYVTEMIVVETVIL
ncbi:hypothetical protein KDV25_18325 [Morganella morganii]|uniref:hypothetical protein n=1 Tax=Morganella morganii TaxID=582 RepID=UPI000F59545D|nr:hypothetical protein [Morganella morganii]HBU8232589.1 hypothetical protein [Morganella morganii]